MEQEATKAKESAAVLSQIKDNLPIISIGLLIIGTLNLVVYYQIFEIDILTYLDITEVLQVQFKLFAISFGVLAVFSVYMAFFTSLRPSYEEMLEQRIWFQALHSPEQIEASRAATQRLLKSSKKRGIIAVAIFAIIPLMYLVKVVLFYEDNDGIAIASLSIFLVGSCIDLAYSSFLDSEPEYVDYFNSKPKFIVARQVGVFIFLIYSSIIVGYIQAVSRRGNISPNEVTITTEKLKVSTNKEVRYIGKTKNFTFFYNVIKKQALVYPNCDIKGSYISAGTDYRTAEEKKEKPISYYFDKVKARIFNHNNLTK